MSDSNSMIGIDDKPVTYSSKIFQDWVKDHEDEIDECEYKISFLVTRFCIHTGCYEKKEKRNSPVGQ